MDEIFDYWVTRRGLKRGQVPNRKALVYASYKRWVLKTFEGEREPLSSQDFAAQMGKRGYEIVVLRNRDGHNAICWLMNKAIVPMSSIAKFRHRWEKTKANRLPKSS